VAYRNGSYTQGSHASWKILESPGIFIGKFPVYLQGLVQRSPDPLAAVVAIFKHCWLKKGPGKCLWGPGTCWKSPRIICNQESGNGH